MGSEMCIRDRSGTSATGHGLHVAERATGLTRTYSGVSLEDGAERSEGSMHREASMHESRPEQQQIKLFRTEWYHGWVRFKHITVYIHIYYCCNSFAVLLYHVTMSSWVGGSLRGCHCCTTYCCTVVVLLYCCFTGLWVGISFRSCRVLLSWGSCLVFTRVCGFFFFLFLPLRIPAPRWHSSGYH